jgi:hypothetical protein
MELFLSLPVWIVTLALCLLRAYRSPRTDHVAAIVKAFALSVLWTAAAGAAFWGLMFLVALADVQSDRAFLVVIAAWAILYIAIALVAFGRPKAGLACAAVLALFIGGAIVREEYERRQSETLAAQAAEAERIHATQAAAAAEAERVRAAQATGALRDRVAQAAEAERVRKLNIMRSWVFEVGPQFSVADMRCVSDGEAILDRGLYYGPVVVGGTFEPEREVPGGPFKVELGQERLIEVPLPGSKLSWTVGFLDSATGLANFNPSSKSGRRAALCTRVPVIDMQREYRDDISKLEMTSAYMSGDPDALKHHETLRGSLAEREREDAARWLHCEIDGRAIIDAGRYIYDDTSVSMGDNGTLYSFRKMIGKIDPATGRTIFNGMTKIGLCDHRPQPLSWKLAFLPIENVNAIACEGPSMSIKDGMLHVFTKAVTLDAKLTTSADGVARTEAGDRVVQYADWSLAIDVKRLSTVKLHCGH